jgi:hypothetical protein
MTATNPGPDLNLDPPASGRAHGIGIDELSPKPSGRRLYEDTVGRLPAQWRTRPVGLLALLVLALAGALIGEVATRPQFRPAPASNGAALMEAASACKVAGSRAGHPYGGQIQDGGTTLFYDTAGTDADSGPGAPTGLTCVLVKLGAPDYVVTRMDTIPYMDTTRAAPDDPQSDEWSGYSATWTYHPETGLDVLIRIAG